ncbi:MAG: type II toxin-antitoxin system HicA family toxin [Actinobacteria bacterium]|nr:type II toxin-antitoxin system HicA family toxin [Actinomycetota bacterium]MCL5883180.1 type II toxin-antitoxin system HicA family toxin [Actinomycetota bacterium]
MPGKLRRLSGKQVISILEHFGFTEVSQRGSHVKLSRESGDSRQILVIPLHKELDRGTLKAIIRQTSRFVNEQELLPYFYTD